MSNQEEHDSLMALARTGDDRALALLFEQHRDRLKRMIHLRMDARIRSRCDASDVLQESFIEYSRRMPDFEESEDTPFFLWLRRLTYARLSKLHRKHLGALIRKADREVSLDSYATTEASSAYLACELAGHFTSVHRNLVRAELESKLRSKLNSMVPNDREILALRHFEELTTTEIAKLLGITQSGVHKRYVRALRRLSDEIKDDADSNWIQ